MTRTHVRRRALLTAGVIAILGGVMLGGRVTDASGRMSTAEPMPSTTYVVANGDTIWDIATRAAPGTDPRPLVEAIERVNHVQLDELVPGQTLLIPSTPASG